VYIGLIGFGLFALACVAFFALLAGTLGYIAVFGNPDTKRWKAFAATHGWDCDGPWRLAGGHAGARWTLSADYDDDRGTGTVTWLQEGVPAATPRLLVLRRVDYERDQSQSPLASGAARLGAMALDVAMAAVAVASNAGGGHVGGSLSISGLRPTLDGLHETAVGGPRFRPRWVVLSEDERTGRTFLDERTEARWLAALDAMPQMYADGDVMFEARSPRLRVRAEGARRRPPLDEVEAFVRLGLALAEHVTGHEGE
jgi:hypothetical protein